MSRRIRRSTEPNRYSATRLGELGLAGAGRPREQEHADRLAGIVEARLEHGDAVDDGARPPRPGRSRAREEVADRGEVDALLLSRIETGRPVSCDSVTITSCGAIVALPALSARLAVSLIRSSTEPGSLAALEILARRAERDRRRSPDRPSGRAGSTSRSTQARASVRRLLRRLRLEADDFEQAAQSRPHLQQACGARSASPRSTRSAGRRDRRQDLVEDARRSVPDACRCARSAACRGCTR